jgi:hypothetical protein
MAFNRVIRYTTKPESAAENEQLIRNVFSELAQSKPAGLHYTAYRQDDGISFVHVVATEGEDNPLSSSPAFAEFQRGIADRCADGPTPADVTVVGTYAG